MDERPDSELLHLARHSADALGVIYERHAPAVFRFLARRVGSQAAQDLLGAVFLVAVDARKRVLPHPSGSALPWLYGVAGNLVRAHLRRAPLALVADGQLSVDWDAVDSRLDALAARAGLRTALGVLTEAEREILLLVAWEELTPTEAAEVLGLTPVAARSRLHRARIRAQAALAALPSAGRNLVEESDRCGS